MLEGKTSDKLSRYSYLTSVQVFLLYQNLDRSSWPKSTRDSRSAYGSLKEHLMQVFDARASEAINDPLSEAPSVSAVTSSPGLLDLC